MNNSNETIQPQAETTQISEKKFGRVSAVGAAIAVTAGALALAVPEGNPQHTEETSITQSSETSTQANDSAPQKVLPGTKFDELSGVSLRLAPNPRRTVETSAQEQTVQVPAPEHSEPTHDSENQDKPVHDKPKVIHFGNDMVTPQLQPEITPAPPVVEVTDGPLPPPENPDPINQ